MNENYYIKFKSFSYRNKVILEDVDINFQTASINGIIGANGSGKSTLLSILNKEKKAKDYSSNIDFKTMSVGYVPQDNPLLEDSTGYDNLLLWYKGTRSEFKKALESPLISMLGIKDYIKLPVKKMSGGMKKRISIAIAVINNPSLLILDEPSAALDLIAKKDIKDYLLSYKKSGGTVIITSHDEDELSICDQIYLIAGKSIKQAPLNMNSEQLVKLLKGDK